MSDAARKGQEKPGLSKIRVRSTVLPDNPSPIRNPDGRNPPQGAGLIKCDNKLETLIKNNFEASQPLKRGNPDYTWYQVNDLAKLSNIMYMSGINVPVFANPKILWDFSGISISLQVFTKVKTSQTSLLSVFPPGMKMTTGLSRRLADGCRLPAAIPGSGRILACLCQLKIGRDCSVV